MDWLSPEEIQQAFSSRNRSFLKEHNGIQGLLAELHTTQNGLDANQDDFTERDIKYFLFF